MTGFLPAERVVLVSLECDNRSSRNYLLRDMFELLQSCRILSPWTKVQALAQADLERAVASAVVAELVFPKLCWCLGTA